MSRRMFDHLFAEISVSVGSLIPRYALWMQLHDLGCEPDAMSRSDAMRFVDDEALTRFLAEHGLPLSPKDRARLHKRIAGFNPDHPTPYEHFEAWSRRH